MAVSGGIVVPVSTSALLMAGMTLAGTASVLRTTPDGMLFVTGSVTTALNSTIAAPGAPSPISASFVGGSDISGTFLGFRTGISGALIVEQQGFAIAHGDLPGVRGYTPAFGYVNSLTDIPVRQSVYNEQSSNAQRSVTSTDTNDSLAGSGSQKVRLTYYDVAGAGPFTETLTLSGTVAVSTVASNICYVENLEFTEYGSSYASSGNITLWSNTIGSGTAITILSAYYTQLQSGIHYTKAGKKTLITGLVACAANTGRWSIRVRDVLSNSASEINSFFYMRSGINQVIDHVFDPPILVAPGFRRIQLFWGGDGSASTACGGTYEWVEVD